MKITRTLDVSGLSHSERDQAIANERTALEAEFGPGGFSASVSDDLETATVAFRTNDAAP